MKSHMSATALEVLASQPPATDDDFWSSRESLSTIRDYARQSFVGPWALLGGVMLRSIADVPPSVAIPAIIGGRASLNLFVGFVGRSGHGKGASDAAARDYWPSAIVELPVGTGEGLAATFYRDVGDPDAAANVPEAAIFSAGEVDTLNVLGGRSGATLFPELRKLAMGEMLGAQNASKDHRRIVPAHTYRACLSVGIQPERAGLLIGDAHGGTPQRFIWLPVTDPAKPNITPTDVAPFTADGVRLSGELPLPPVVFREVRAHRDRVLREDPTVDPLDGHRNLTRIKVAAALMLIDGRSEVTEDDWRLSEYVMAKSDDTRKGIETALEKERRRGAADAAQTSALRVMLTGDAAVRLVAEKILARLVDGHMSRSDLRRSIAHRAREHFDDALDQLELAGQVDVTTTEQATYVRLRPP